MMVAGNRAERSLILVANFSGLASAGREDQLLLDSCLADLVGDRAHKPQNGACRCCLCPASLNNFHKQEMLLHCAFIGQMVVNQVLL